MNNGEKTHSRRYVCEHTVVNKSGVAKLSELMERKTHEFSNKTVTEIIELISLLDIAG